MEVTPFAINAKMARFEIVSIVALSQRLSIFRRILWGLRLLMVPAAFLRAGRFSDGLVAAISGVSSTFACISMEIRLERHFVQTYRFSMSCRVNR